MITLDQRKQLHLQLTDEEGLFLKPYKDQVGVLTVGIGHNLEARPLTLTYPITKEKALEIFDRDIDDTINELIPKINFWQLIDKVRQIVLIDMAFNMGVSGLLEFKHMLKFLQEKYFHNAALEMLNSKWAMQVQKSRVDRLVHMMESGEL